MTQKRANPPAAASGLGICDRQAAKFHNPENSASRLILKAKNFAAPIASIDPAALVALVFLAIGRAPI